MVNWTNSGFNSKRLWPEPPLATRCGDSHRVGSDSAMAHSPSLSTRLVRSAVTYRLLEPHDLHPPLAPWLAAQASHPAFGGVLMPTEDGFRVQRVVTRDTARLFRALAKPQRPPRAIPSRALRALVLDGVLEIREGRRYVSGASARRYCLSVREAPEPGTTIGMLSLAALRTSAALELPSSGVLARLLYSFNTLPATPDWRRRYPAAMSLDSVLRRSIPGSAGLGAPETAGDGAWLSWDRAAPSRSEDRVWKLYLSPMPEHLLPALEAAAHQREAFSIKVGRDLANILRADKLVLYFATRARMERAAGRLERELAGIPAQGVPFTRQVGDSALLSWGVDPDGQDAAAPWSGDSSWRAWLTHRLATALVQAFRDPGCSVPAWRYAMDRVSLDGVDVRDWTPERRSKTPRRRHGHH